MSVRPIFLTEEMKSEMVTEFQKTLDKAKLLDGKFRYETCYYWESETDEKGRPIQDEAVICFSELAQRKQDALIADFNTEVGWHGIVHRDPEDDHVFHIDDILVYPQSVTGSTVRTDDLEYPKWLYESVPADQLNSLLYFGHSHVHMQPTPSGKDDEVALEMAGTVLGDGLLPEAKEAYLQNADRNAFYICGIWNKRGDYTMRVFDVYNNKFYDSESCLVANASDGALDDFLADARSKVKTPTTERRRDPYGFGEEL